MFGSTNRFYPTVKLIATFAYLNDKINTLLEMVSGSKSQH